MIGCIQIWNAMFERPPGSGQETGKVAEGAFGMEVWGLILVSSNTN
jgi:hypothetical protein